MFYIKAMSRQATILCIGTELVTGKHLDTNSRYLSAELCRMGLPVRSIVKAGDDLPLLKTILREAWRRSDVILTTGGLGPTPDDITRDAVAGAFGLRRVYSEEAFRQIRIYFKKRGKEPLPGARRQAYVFPGARILINRAGTAPGLIVEKDKKALVVLPGPPLEMRLMFEKSVRPYLKRRYGRKGYEKILRMAGITESEAAEKMSSLEEGIIRRGGDVIYLATPGLADVILLFRKKDAAAAEAARKAGQLFRKHVYSGGEKDLYRTVTDILKKRKLTVSVAESCTGGLVSKTLTDFPGSSHYLRFGAVSYSDLSKRKILGVQKETLRRYGAVSSQTAREMLDGLQRIERTGIAVSITGIAGPKGGSAKKPVGTVFIGLRYGKKETVEKHHFSGNREKIREYALNKVFELIWKRIRHAD